MLTNISACCAILTIIFGCFGISNMFTQIIALVALYMIIDAVNTGFGGK